MNAQQMARNFAEKVKRYDLAACEFAIADCHAALESLGDSCSASYKAEKWAEIDALRDRKAQISNPRLRKPRTPVAIKMLIPQSSEVVFSSNW